MKYIKCIFVHVYWLKRMFWIRNSAIRIFDWHGLWVFCKHELKASVTYICKYSSFKWNFCDIRMQCCQFWNHRILYQCSWLYVDKVIVVAKCYIFGLFSPTSSKNNVIRIKRHASFHQWHIFISKYKHTRFKYKHILTQLNPAYSHQQSVTTENYNERICLYKHI